MTTTRLHTTHRKILADCITPVEAYLKLRDMFSQPILLESSEYGKRDNSFSYLCFNPLASLEMNSGKTIIKKGEECEESTGTTRNTFSEQMCRLLDCFEHDLPETYDFLPYAAFGYSGFEAVQYMENIHYKSDPLDGIPEVSYAIYGLVLVFDHFKNDLHLFHHSEVPDYSLLDKVLSVLNSGRKPVFEFQHLGQESSTTTPEEYLELVEQGIRHCELGDCFQVVFSRRFEQKFSGDEFQVYRALRNINPSPYLFYFDLDNIKLIGSSPEAQLSIQKGKAEIHPIAGTVKRTGNDDFDRHLEAEMCVDEKETAEHAMLVDLARNDLNRVADSVRVEQYAQVQRFSHVSHLVSKVIGEVSSVQDRIRLFGECFPAGTLSGAPKYRALELIRDLEPHVRGYYGGAIGFICPDGHSNHAILIRSILSRNNCLHYQAGAGITHKSKPEGELKEVDNKVAAIRKAIQQASEL